MSLGLLLGATSGLGKDLLLQAGAAAAAIAFIGILLCLPLYLTQRREVKRLLRWQELEPERGEEGSRAEYEAAVAASATRPTTTGGFPAVRSSTGYMSPAERVTADRPALSRITAERAALESPSFWRRTMARGPRHPLVLSLIAIVLAAGIVLGVGLISGTIGGEPDSATNSKSGGGGLDKAAVAVVVLNGSGTPALADRVADDISSAGFENVRTGATGSTNQTIVLYGKGQKREAGAVGRAIGVDILQPIDRAVTSIAPDADVVVVAGEDRARA